MLFRLSPWSLAVVLSATRTFKPSRKVSCLNRWSFAPMLCRNMTDIPIRLKFNYANGKQRCECE